MRGRIKQFLKNHPTISFAKQVQPTSTTHNVPCVDRAYVDVLLTNVNCGNIVTASSADRKTYVAFSTETVLDM